MSGHSKWSQIKRTKGVLDQKRGVLFSKLSKKISIAVREGGSGDPGTNYKLKSAIEYSKAQGMPNDNIDRAIKNATGTGAVQIKEVVYEGYGPFGTAFLVEVATDNTNRAFNNVRKIFSDHDGSTGAQGSVAWQFSTKGQILVERDSNISNLEMAAIDAGADDVRESDEGLEVYTQIQDLQKIKDALTKAGAKIAQADIIKESSQGTDLTEEQKPKVDALFAALENDEDVIAVHTSANL
jgi:YebC/PmpR family DNA-binding regulatory protein